MMREHEDLVTGPQPGNLDSVRDGVTSTNEQRVTRLFERKGDRFAGRRP